MSAGTYSSQLSGFPTGPDAACLSDITTNTGWKGYSTANSNGQLVAGKVHAFLCNAGDCSNLMPLTTYVFANAGNSSAGGASFTTDAYGNGANNNAEARQIILAVHIIIGRTGVQRVQRRGLVSPTAVLTIATISHRMAVCTRSRAIPDIQIIIGGHHSSRDAQAATI
jgi:hypothetical protein